MDERLAAGKAIKEWKKNIPVLEEVQKAEEVFWINTGYGLSFNSKVSKEEIGEAERRLERFAPYLMEAFPETVPAGGMIESPLLKAEGLKRRLQAEARQEIKGELFLKCDNQLPISGSIKARGGIYEVLKHAEELALQSGLLKEDDDYSVLASDRFREFFSGYSIAVGSTGNLGLSIGLIGAKLGFKVKVHMSSDAKKWKKNKLRSLGVDVIEYSSDYSAAVKEGRKQAESDPLCYFIDDENSKNLFLGYATAAGRLKRQLDERGLTVDEEHPLFVYLPCGVGGGPGGITFGLKAIFKEHVHCFYAEPVESPCMLLSLATGLHDQVAVEDFGLTNRTEADGLAVGRASGFVSKTIQSMLAGVFTIKDGELFRLQKEIWREEGIFLEPSAAAGASGPVKLLKSPEGNSFLDSRNVKEKMENAIHIIWATGGSMVPESERLEYLNKKEL